METNPLLTPFLPENLPAAKAPPVSHIKNPRGQSIACAFRPGKGPVVIYLHGYKSDMNATKALYLDRLCAATGWACLRFDYTGGSLSEGSFDDCLLGDWIEDSLAALDSFVQDEKALLVGSSTGGWIALHLALNRPEKVTGMVGIAAAPDFTIDLWENRASEADREEARQTGALTEKRPEYEGEPFRITLRFIEESRKHALLEKPIPLCIPVVLLQGKKDTEVKPETATRLQTAIGADKTEIVWVEDGDHRLSRDCDLTLLGQAVATLLSKSI
jgi:pimeloyl-ACP methyl ester carboxylesterase